MDDNNDRPSQKWIFWIVGSSIILLLLVQGFFAQVPVPHGVAGWIHQSDGTTQVALGTDFRVNDSNSTFFIQDVTSVPVPGNTGRYSVSIDGNNNDTVFIHAWTSLLYGETIISLQGDMDHVNVTVGTVRPPEANVTITGPPDGETFNVTDEFTLNATFALLGGANGIDCNVTLVISDESVYNVSSGESFVKELGNVNLGVEKEVSFNMTTEGVGSSVFTLRGSCANSGLNFEGEHIDTITLIATVGSVPVVTLILPENNTKNTTTNNITFTYNVTHPIAIDNCSLMIDGSINFTQEAPDKDIQNNISILLDNGQYNWSVLCYDNLGAGNVLEYWNLTVEVYWPAIYAIALQTPIDLQAGINTTISCNASVWDGNGVADIITVNATFYDQSLSQSSDPDNANWHYTNGSCLQFQADTNTANYTCTFSLRYFTYNGSWACNVTIVDGSDNRNSSDLSGSINQLVALDSSSLIEFGNVQPESVSAEQTLLLTNVGNTGFNVSTNGYGETPNDNLSMVCGSSQDINITYLHYAVQAGLSHAAKTALLTDITEISNFKLPKRTSEAGFESDRNNTYWTIEVPTAMKTDTCNGTLLLYATIN